MNQPALFKGLHPSIRQVKASQPLTAQQLKEAEQIRHAWGRCIHETDCGTYKACVRLIAEHRRAR